MGLSDYDTVLWENNKTNGMLESVNVFEKVINEQFSDINVPIFLILNKDDLFRNKLRKEKVPLSKCFSQQGNWPKKNEYFHDVTDFNIFDRKNNIEADEAFEKYHSKCVEFISGIFINRIDDLANRKLYKRIVRAVSTDDVKQMFEYIHNLI